MTSRADQLLKAAADALDDGRSPFEHPFLVEHDVTLDEVYTLSETLAAAARYWVTLPARTRGAALVAQIAEQVGIPPARAAAAVDAVAARADVIDRLS